MNPEEQESWERTLRHFVNSIAYELEPSNDTMNAVRLIRKKLPEILLLQHKRTLAMVKSKLWKATLVCHRCGKAGSNPFGECQCSYEIPDLGWGRVEKLLEEVDKALDLNGGSGV